MSDRKKLLQQIDDLKKPTEHGRYAETGYNDHFNDGVDAAYDLIDSLPEAEPAEQVAKARKALDRYRDRNSKPNPEHLADALSDLLEVLESAKVTEQARIHYRYGVNSGTLETINTPEHIASTVQQYERQSMGPIGVEKVETRTKIEWKSEWADRKNDD